MAQRVDVQPFAFYRKVKYEVLVLPRPAATPSKGLRAWPFPESMRTIKYLPLNLVLCPLPLAPCPLFFASCSLGSLQHLHLRAVRQIQLPRHHHAVALLQSRHHFHLVVVHAADANCTRLHQ